MTALNDLVDDMAAVTGAPCTLEDPEFRLVAFSSQQGDELLDVVRRRSILERGSTPEVCEWFHAHGIREAARPVRIPGDTAAGIAGRLCVPARHLGRVLGYFWLLDPEVRIDESSWPEAMHIAESAAELLNLVERRQTNRDELYRHLIESPLGDDRRSAGELAAAAGLDVRASVTCVLVRRPELAEQLASKPSRPGVLWARESDEVCAAIVRADVLDQEDTLQQVLARLGLSRRLAELDDATNVGIGPVVNGLDHLPRSRSGAGVALRVALDRGTGEVVRWSQLGVLALLGTARDDDLSRAVLPGGLKAFVDSAPRDLVTTALVYLEEAGSVSRAAQQLAVHRQTVYHRLTQVERLSGCDLSLGSDRLRLHLALALAPFLRRR
jgi:hypothetical protein